MTSKIVVNNIEADAGVSTVTLLTLMLKGVRSQLYIYQELNVNDTFEFIQLVIALNWLTGVSGVTINSNAANRIITGSGSANTIRGKPFQILHILEV